MASRWRSSCAPPPTAAYGRLPRVAAAIAAGFLHSGLHAAHEARSEQGEPLNIVHRDISPQNIIVGTDGVPRVVDFGVAKAVGRVQTTRDGQIKGKLAYMAPEQISGAAVTRSTDIYAASAVLWELLTGRRLINGDNDGAVVAAVLLGAPPEPPSAFAPVPVSIDRVVLRGLSRQPEARFQSAREMALEIEQAMEVAMPSEVGAWVQSMAFEALSVRAALVGSIESRPRVEPPSSHSRLRASEERVPAVAVSENVSTTEPPTLLTSSKEDESRPRTYRVSISLGIAAVLAVVGVVFYARASVHPHAATMPAPPAVAVAPPPSSAPLPVPPLASEMVAAVATRVPVEPPPPAVPSVASNALVRTPRVHAPASPAPAKRASPTASCDPPYRIDPSGRKIFKMECL